MTALFHAGDGPGCSSGRSPGLVPLRPAGRPARGGRMLLSTRWPEEEGPVTRTRSTRRTVLGGLTAAGVPVPALLRAQPRTGKIGRIFPGSATFGRNAVRYMTEIFREAGVSPKRIVLMYSNDLFGKTQTDSFQAALKAANPGYEVVDVIPYPENAVDLSTEVARARSAKPDVLAPVTRPATAILLLEELARQRADLMGIISPGAPGLC